LYVYPHLRPFKHTIVIGKPALLRIGDAGNALQPIIYFVSSKP